MTPEERAERLAHQEAILLDMRAQRLNLQRAVNATLHRLAQVNTTWAPVPRLEPEPDTNGVYRITTLEA